MCWVIPPASDVCLADIVEQRSLTVVDMSHHHHDRRTRNQFILIIGLVFDRLLNLHRDEFDRKSELLGHNHQRFGIETLVDRNHQAEVHAGRNHIVDRYVHHRRQLAHRNELGNLQYRTFVFGAFDLLVHLGRYGLSLLLSVFGTLALGILGRQTCQRILNLLCHLLVAHFGTYDRFWQRLLFLLVLLADRLLWLCSLRRLRRHIAAAVLFRRHVLLRLGYIHLVLGDTLALGMAASGLELRYVDRSDHVRPGQLCTLRPENVILTLRHTLIVCLVVEICRRSDRCRLYLLSRRCRLGLLRNCRCRTLFFRGPGRFRRRYRRCRNRFGRRLLPTRFHMLRNLLLLHERCRRLLRFRAFAAIIRQVDLADYLRPAGPHFILDRKNTFALDHDLIPESVVTLLAIERHRGLFLRDPFAHVAARIRTAIRSELLVQNGVNIRFDQRTGRTLDRNALLFKEIRNRIDSYLKLSCNLMEPKPSFV